MLKRVVVIGGGTGNFVLLTGLKQYDIELSAVVSMADDGGSTGVLRDELGVLPPGDVRQCLVALSNSSRLMRSLMSYRFEREHGSLSGHTFGNLLLSTLEKVTGSFERAVEEAGRILSIKGKVLPVTTHEVRLKMVLKDGAMLHGEGEIYASEKIDQGYEDLYLEPSPEVNRLAVDEIMNADAVVLGPGGLYTSLIPNLLVSGLAKALCKTQAECIFVQNLMNKNGQTTGMKTSDYLRELRRFMNGQDPFHYILVNSAQPQPEALELYAHQGTLIENDVHDDPRIIACDLLSDRVSQYSKGDALSAHRTLIRHDSAKLASAIMKIVDRI
ncbi:YvcK family protein [Candidatus Sumerlaeota bacterium]|nr:YvcK family protein [Candidatus Sumerlaeota bacterium]